MGRCHDLGRHGRSRVAANCSPWCWLGGTFLSHEGKTMVLRRQTDGAVEQHLAFTGRTFDGRETTLVVVEGLEVRVIQEGRTTPLGVPRERSFAVALSPDGARVAVGHETGVSLFRSTGELLASHTFGAEAHVQQSRGGLAWSPDGGRLGVLVMDDRSGYLRLLDGQSLEVVANERFETSRGSILAPFTPRLALVCPQGRTADRIGVIDLETAELGPSLKLSANKKKGMVLSVAVSASCKMAVATFRPGDDDRVLAMSLLGLAPLQVLSTVTLPDDDERGGAVVFASNDAAVLVEAGSRVVRFELVGDTSP